MSYKIEEKTFASSLDRTLHQKKLWDFTVEQKPETDPREMFTPYNVFLRDENDEVIAGSYGFSSFKNFVIEIFWVDEAHRRKKVGFELYFALEEIARKRGCNQLIGSMYDFHGSRPFFEKVGGTCFATLKNPQTEMELYYVHKSLS